jgi:hypothetical protein
VPEFVNPKYADADKIKFKSATRLECMMQDLPALMGPEHKVVSHRACLLPAARLPPPRRWDVCRPAERTERCYAARILCCAGRFAGWVAGGGSR